MFVFNSGYISTHSLTRRLTIVAVDNDGDFKHFNSQPHKEADDMKGVFLWQNLHFNSQPHKEADIIAEPVPEPFFEFQLTASQGG